MKDTPDDGNKISRRGLLAGAAAVVGTKMLGGQAHAGRNDIPKISGWNSQTGETIAPTESVRVREQWIGRVRHEYGARISANDELLRNGDPQTAFRFAIQEQPQLTEAHLKGTKYDIEHLKHRFTFMFVVVVEENGQKKIHIIPPNGDQDTLDRLIMGQNRRAGYGNCVFTGKKTMMLPAHVAALAEPDPNSWRRMRSDVVFIDVPPEFEVPRENRVNSGEMPPTEDLHGKLVVVIGADPDGEGDHEGFKTFVQFGVAPRGAVMRALDIRDPVMRGFTQHSLTIPLPAEAARERDDTITGRGVSRPISGVSGGHVFVWDDDLNRWKFAGCIWSAKPANTGERYASGFLNTPDIAREAYANDRQRVRPSAPFEALPGRVYGTRNWRVSQ